MELLVLGLVFLALASLATLVTSEMDDETYRGRR